MRNELFSTKTSDDISLRALEKSLWDQGYNNIIGVDEAGRGPLAGPVVAAAVCAPSDSTIFEARDSKILSEKSRNFLYEKFFNDCSYQIAFSIIDHSVIDEVNILQATMMAMNNSILSLVERYQLRETSLRAYALVDGNKAPSKLPMKCRAVVRGDALVYPIALASIVAKVERDKIMVF